MRILIASGAKGKFEWMQELSNSLNKLDVKCKLVKDSDYARGFPSKRLSEWVYSHKKFENLINDFKPDIVLIDRQTYFGTYTIKSKIPLFVYLLGNYWLEIESAKKTLYKNPIMRLVIWLRGRTAKKCFEGSTVILPITKYIEKEVKEKYPKKKIDILSVGVVPSVWETTSGMHLKHPCVGLLQTANIWLKTKELLILPKIMEAMPNVMFYWAGDGTYIHKILPLLKKYDNFKWLGSISYPDKVKEYLSEIDVYALISGLDTLGVTLLEAMLMKKPIIATNVGGIPEIIEDGKSGFLIEKGDHIEWINKLDYLINNKQKAKEMSEIGYKFAKDNFNWDKIAKNLLRIINSRNIF
jgi:glycosyltransferase involved in cell wall biosynthesis